MQLKENLTYEEILVQIVDRKEQVLRSKMIPFVKVLWKNHERGSYLGARGPDAPSVPSLILRMRYVPSLLFGVLVFISRTK